MFLSLTNNKNPAIWKQLEDGTYVYSGLKHNKTNGLEYKVYEMVNGKEHTIAYCKEYICAKAIAVALALADPKGDEYFVTSVAEPDTLTMGGGWYDGFAKDLKTGKIMEWSLG